MQASYIKVLDHNETLRLAALMSIVRSYLNDIRNELECGAEKWGANFQAV